ncbi:MAG: hypothetical protein V2I76_01010 [Roseobacter sp.]|jgi:hypothetical protein|nr:hypothetical protein [Roseobacter sp.]
MISKCLPVLVALAIPSASIASTVTIDTVSGSQSYISQHGIRDNTATLGRDLVGMVVTASYLDGATEEVTWGEVRGGGEASGTGFNLFYGWRAFELSVTRTLVSLSLNALTGNAIFDILPSRRDPGNTYGTKIGYPFHVVGDDDPDGAIDVSYSSRVIVAGQPHGTDAYTHMSIDFSGLEGGGLSSDLEFSTDLDSLAVAGDLTPVPLPASLLLFGSALGVMGAGSLRKRKRTV